MSMSNGRKLSLTAAIAGGGNKTQRGVREERKAKEKKGSLKKEH